jgi:hypothetical protein
MGQLHELVLHERAIRWIQAVRDWSRAGRILPEQVGVSVFCVPLFSGSLTPWTHLTPSLSYTNVKAVQVNLGGRL